MKLLVTGTAGFIGSALARRLLNDGHEVVGVDSVNSYYDPMLKRARLKHFCDHPRYCHSEIDIADSARLKDVFVAHKPERVLHMAAQAGVRYASENPDVYAQSNLVGFLNILEGCRRHGASHLVFASTSSVYGGQEKMPFSERDHTEHPLSLYAATKKANEMMAHSYAHLYGLPCTGLRFFTVYGPWGRPDMSYFRFADAIMAGRPIQVYNHGLHTRDFTYVEDIVDGIVRTMALTPMGETDADPTDPSRSRAPYRIYNIGNQNRVQLNRFIEVLEKALGRNSPAPREMLPLQPGDVPDTHADVSELMRATGYAPETPIEIGLKNFADWYLTYRTA